MTNNNSLTWIDQLATETILDIFEYLSSNDIIYAFFDFNQRFNSILFHHQYYLQNFETPTTNLYFWQNVLPEIGSNIQNLIITTIDFPFSLNLFPNLKSLIISSSLPISYDQLYSITESEQFTKLISFKIHSEIYDKKFRRNLFDNIFNSNNSLQIFEISKPCFSYDNVNKFMINNNISSLSLNVSEWGDIRSLLHHVPNLKKLNLTLNYESLTYILNSLKTKLEKFSCTLRGRRNDRIDYRSFLDCFEFIKQFSSSLIYLSMNLSEIRIYEDLTFHFDANLLQQHLLESMIKLKSFHFYARLTRLSAVNILSTFENEFWFDHNWSFGMYGQYIYTLPFHFDQLKDFIDFNHIHSNDLNFSQTWSHVSSLDFDESYTLNSNLIEQINIKMPKLTSLFLPSTTNDRLYIMKDIDAHGDEIIKDKFKLKNVKTLRFKGTVKEHFQQSLISILPNLKTLILRKMHYFIPIIYDKIEKLIIHNGRCLSLWNLPGDIYFPNLKYLDIELERPEEYDLMEIFKSFSRCKTLMIHFRSYDPKYSNRGEININKIFNELDLIEILEHYRINLGVYCVEFIQKIINS